jgi:hypothetical protein
LLANAGATLVAASLEDTAAIISVPHDESRSLKGGPT